MTSQREQSADERKGEGQLGDSVDVREHGAAREGQPQTLDRRLFMQLVVFDSRGKSGALDALRELGAELERRQAPSVLYEDLSHPDSIGLLAYSEDPSDFVTKVRGAYASARELGLRVRPALSMIGRTYSSGFEPDLEYWLLRRPRETVQNPAWPWAIWYPLRRSGAFERLPPEVKGQILREHAQIGKAYGAKDLAHDIRLACHGLDAHDNEFVIGLVGKELYPLSHLLQAMRRTRQTSEYISQMGPFFVGRVAWRSPA
ncbi:MAG TPA: chlorite dismutase family protein [Polyangiaceae bacterium]